MSDTGKSLTIKFEDHDITGTKLALVRMERFLLENEQVGRVYVTGQLHLFCDSTPVLNSYPLQKEDQ